MSYAVDIALLPARIVAFDGQETWARIFLHAASERYPRAEVVADRLNDPRLRFLPCEVDGAIELFQLSWVAYVEYEGRLPEVEELERVGAVRQKVTLGLVTREVLVGDLLYVMPEGQSRVSDLLNSPRQRFLLLLTDTHTCYVNIGALVRVYF